MSAERKIIFCYSQRDKKWADRLQSAISRATGNENLTMWSDTAGFGKPDSPSGTFESALSGAAVAVMLTSEHLLHSGFWSKAKRTIQRAVDQGGLDLLVLPLSHCLHDLSWLRDYASIGKADQPLDSINTTRRDAALEEVARQILRVLSRSTDSPAIEFQPEPVEEPVSTASAANKAAALAGGSAYARKLSSFVHAQKEILLRQRRLGRILLIITLASVAMAIAFAMGNQSIEIFLIIAGFGAFVASLALALAARRALLAQRIVSAQYVRVGFIDETIPSRQRAALTRKADLLLGNF